VLDPFGKIAVVGQDQEAFGIVIQPPRGEDALADLAEKVGDDRPTLGILQRRHVPGGLVEHEVDLLHLGRNQPPVDTDFVAPGVGPGPQLSDDPVVDLDLPGKDEILGCPS